MALQKQNLDMRFGQGLDLKTDPWQVQPGKFLALSNCVFDTGGMLKKRNGFGLLTTLPDTSYTQISTLAGGLVALGNNLSVYNRVVQTWVNNATFSPLTLSVSEVFYPANSLNSFFDIAVASNGFACGIYLSGGNYFFHVIDTTTQTVLAGPTTPIGLNYTTQPRVFVLGNYFVIVVADQNTGVYYYSIPLSNPTSIAGPTPLSSATTTSFIDGVVYNNTLYIAWYSTSTTISFTSLSSSLVQGSTTAVVAPSSSGGSPCLSLTATATGKLWLASAVGTTTTVFAVSTSFSTLLAPTTILSSTTLVQLTAVASDASGITIYGQVENTYGFSPNRRSDYIITNTCTLSGTVGTASTILRSVGIASKAFQYNNTTYMLAIYGNSSSYQPTMFLITGSGQIISRFAYSNAVLGYYSPGTIPSVSVSGNQARIGYLYQDLVEAISGTSGSNANVYNQIGANLATFTFGEPQISTAEIAGSLNIAGGFLWMFDGASMVEQGFHLWPEDITLVGGVGGGFMTAQTYYYYVTYEWQDAKGNVHRSAPSVPQSITLSATGQVTLNIPTLRLTHKTWVRINAYRWSTAQQTPYSIFGTTVLLSSPTTDYLVFSDTLSDAQILGNEVIYTFGGVVENIAGPATNNVSLFNGRLFLVDAEDPNTLWFSKQVIESTPVELSDLFTFYLPPSVGAEGNTGGITCTFPMDDKLIVYKSNAIYYITGLGPDNTGANSDYPSIPTFISSVVGCPNPASIVFMPNGLIFQSNKGFWLLGRDLSINYVGAPVEAYNGYSCVSAVAIPSNNQVRFTMSNGTILVYDYFFQQWGTFQGITPIAGALYNSLHTLLDASGNVYQETPGTYVDGASSPVLMSFTTNWMTLSGLQGYQRAYQIQLIGQYLSAHSLSCSIAYDFGVASQATVIMPTGSESWRLWLDQQQCEAFQLSVQEQATTPGAGFTLSGLNLVVGLKNRYRPQAASQSSS